MNIHPRDTGKEASNVRWSGVVSLPSDDLRAILRARLLPERAAHRGDLLLRRAQRLLGRLPAQDLIDGWFLECRPGDGQIILRPRPNLVVDVGVTGALDRNFNIGGPPNAVQRIGMDNGTTNPVAASVSSDAGGGADTGSSTQTLRTFDSTATRTAKVVTASGTFNDPTTGGIGAVGFVQKRLFLSRHAANITNTTSADAANSLYSMTAVFTIDFTLINTWSAVFAATVTGAGS